MITDEQLAAAELQHDEAEKIISAYYQERLDAFEGRLKANPVFTDDELIYSAYSLCPCGHGLAYPAACGPNHYWDCSAILKGTADQSVKHTGQLPFAFYDVKAERMGRTTRGVFRPKDPDAFQSDPYTSPKG
jgi:hypothetical protein